jgi:hypothetical protein
MLFGCFRRGVIAVECLDIPADRHNGLVTLTDFGLPDDGFD